MSSIDPGSLFAVKGMSALVTGGGTGTYSLFSHSRFTVR